MIKYLLLFTGPAAYVGVFTFLIACGLGVPLPEDIILITGGLLAATRLGPGSVYLMMLVGLLGILIGDSIIFKAGHDYGEKLLETRLGKHIPREKLERTKELFARHGPKFIMVARFIPGVRAVTYFVAGTSKVRYWVFIGYDGLAALVSAPVWVWVGYWAGKRRMIRRAFEMAKQFQLGLLGMLAVVGLCTALYVHLRKLRQRRAKASEVVADAQPRNGELRNGHAKVTIPSTPAPGIERV